MSQKGQKPERKPSANRSDAERSHANRSDAERSHANRSDAERSHANRSDAVRKSPAAPPATKTPSGKRANTAGADRKKPAVKNQRKTSSPIKSNTAPGRHSNEHRIDDYSFERPDARIQNISSPQHAAHIRANHRKRAMRGALFLGIIVILILVVTAAAILYVTDYVKAKPNYSFISMGTIEHSVGATALIVRDEQTFPSTSQGSLVALATEGSRVAKSQQLAMVIPAGLEDTSASLRNVQQQIVDLQRQLMVQGKGIGAQAIYSEADTSILPIIYLIRSDSILDNYTNLMSYSSSIQVLMDKRDSDLQAIDFQDEQLSALVASKNDLETTLAAQSVTLIAEIPGIVSYKLDGLENELNSTAVMSMFPDLCTKYISSSKASIPNDLNIKANEPALRICQNDTQYLATNVAGCSVTDFPVDGIKTIRVPSEGIVIKDCKVVRSVQSANGVFVVFQTTNQVERLLDRRTVEIEIVQSETDPGLRVPVSALIDADFNSGYAQILYNSSGYASKLTVTVIDHDREYAIIAPVQGFDLPNTSTIIITNPNTISAGDKVEQ